MFKHSDELKLQAIKVLYPGPTNDDFQQPFGKGISNNNNISKIERKTVCKHFSSVTMTTLSLDL